MITFSQDGYDDVVDHAITEAPAECCGLLVGTLDDEGPIVTEIHPTENVADEPRTTYEVDPAAQLAIMTDCDERDETIVGFYHSHPNGPPRPSPTDVARATWAGYVYAIVSLSGEHPFVGAWRWGGERFEQVAISIR